MTRKHFTAIANVIRSQDVTVAQRRTLASDMAMVLAQTNPNFNRSRFLEACEAK